MVMTLTVLCRSGGRSDSNTVEDTNLLYPEPLVGESCKEKTFTKK